MQIQPLDHTPPPHPSAVIPAVFKRESSLAPRRHSRPLSGNPVRLPMNETSYRGSQFEGMMPPLIGVETPNLGVRLNPSLPLVLYFA